jgi:hypothetical protein
MHMHRPIRLAPLALAMLLGGCGESSPPPAETPDVSAETLAAERTASPPPEAVAPAVPAAPAMVDACTLLTQEEVEAAGGRKALAARGQAMAELSTCEWGDPEAPKIGDKPLVDLVELSLFTGSNAYFAGPVEQAREVFRTARANTSADEPVVGLGEDAWWDGRTLHVLRAAHLLEVTVDPESREAAETLVRAALGRLP